MDNIFSSSIFSVAGDSRSLPAKSPRILEQPVTDDSPMKSMRDQYRRENSNGDLIKALEFELEQEQRNMLLLLQEQMDMSEKVALIASQAKKSAEKVQSVTNLLQKLYSESSPAPKAADQSMQAQSASHFESRPMKRELSPATIDIDDSDDGNIVSKRPAVSVEINTKRDVESNPPSPQHSPPKPTTTKSNSIGVAIDEQRRILERITSTLVSNFSRKTRSLLVYEGSNSALEGKALVSTLEGNINVVDVDTRSSVRTIFGSFLKYNWIEDMKWLSSDILAVCSNKYEPEKEKSQIALISNWKNDQFSSVRIHHLDQAPHGKNVSCIGSIALNRNLLFATGGLDKKVCIWAVDTQKNCRAKTLHEIHTSRVTCIQYNSFQDLLVTGGSDNRLVQYSLTHNKVVSGKDRLDAPIRDMAIMETDPNLVVVSFLDSTGTIQVLDARLNRKILSFYSHSKSTFYQYLSLHRQQNYVSFGGNPDGTLNVWDLRYINVQSEPCQKFYLDNEMISAGKFLESRNSIAALSMHNLHLLQYR